jgi:hypothetical protein
MEVFRRRRGDNGPQDDDDAAVYDEDGDYDEDQAYGTEAGAYGRGEGYVQDEASYTDEAELRAGGGPWDAGEPHPRRDRVDLGSLRVPAGPEYEVQLAMHEQHGAWVAIRHGQSELQLQAFAAPRSGALWDDVRGEIAAEIRAAGGRSMESAGPFGVALDADVPAEPGQPASGMRRVRFVGVDGPRWFLRGLFSGPAAQGAGAQVLEAVFRDIVVCRGEHPVPPRELLELRLPPDAQQALAEQMAAQAGQQGPAEQASRFRGDLSPFDRGPEFTETR